MEGIAQRLGSRLQQMLRTGAGMSSAAKGGCPLALVMSVRAQLDRPDNECTPRAAECLERTSATWRTVLVSG